MLFKKKLSCNFICNFFNIFIFLICFFIFNFIFDINLNAMNSKFSANFTSEISQDCKVGVARTIKALHTKNSKDEVLVKCPEMIEDSNSKLFYKLDSHDQGIGSSIFKE